MFKKYICVFSSCFILFFTLYSPLIGSIWYNLGMTDLVYPDLGHKSSSFAQYALEQAYTYRPEDMSTKRYLGLAWAASGNLEKALDLWRDDPHIAKIVIQRWRHTRHQEYSLDPEFWYEVAKHIDSMAVSHDYKAVGKDFLWSQDLEGAFLAFQRITEIDPQNRDGWYHLARTYLWRDGSEKALNTYQNALKGTRGDIGLSDIYYQIGYIKHRHLKPPQINQAWRSYEKALSYADFWDVENHADTYFQQGSIFSRRNQYDKAIEKYEQALALSPRHYWALLSLANSQWQLEFYEQAKNNVQKAIDFNPKRKNAYMLLGKFFQDEENISASKKMYLKALQIDPEDKIAKEYLQHLDR